MQRPQYHRPNPTPTTLLPQPPCPTPLATAPHPVVSYLVGEVVPLCCELPDVVPHTGQVPLSMIVTLLQLTHLKPEHSTTQHSIGQQGTKSQLLLLFVINNTIRISGTQEHTPCCSC